MIITSFGSFDGKSWERLCQLVFKRKFATEGYLQIPATPGDYGLEGFTKSTGYGFQCYCPEKVYPSKDLHIKQRDKITDDLNKLKKYETDLVKLLGPTKLRRWCFVTPEIAHHDLLKHAQAKEAEVRNWNLSILAPDFEVVVQDGDHYVSEIHEMLLVSGKALDFGGLATTLPVLESSAGVYQANILRKSRARLEGRVADDKLDIRTVELYERTLRHFLDHDSHFRRINEQAPPVHSRLIRLINGYESFVLETCSTWQGTPQELTEKIRDGLTQRIVKDLSPAIDETSANQIAWLMVCRWIAVCEVDFG